MITSLRDVMLAVADTRDGFASSVQSSEIDSKNGHTSASRGGRGLLPLGCLPGVVRSGGPDLTRANNETAAPATDEKELV